MGRHTRVSRALVTITALLALSAGASAETIRFVNGRWFDGAAFAQRVMYSVDGTLQERIDGDADRVVDLGGGWVVPAFGEAHNHNVNRPASAKELDRYLSHGILYVMILNNFSAMPGRTPIESPVEVLYSNGGITPSDGHVVELYETLVDRGVLRGMTKESLDGLAFWVVDDTTELDAKWDRLLDQRPDFIKIYLGFSGEDRPDEQRWYGKRGLDPAIAADVVRRAHEAGLRVAAHIETADDFRAALDAGVDLIAHIPAWRIGTDAGYDTVDLSRWLLTGDDAERAARANVIVMTTVLAGSTTMKADAKYYETVRDIHRRNLATLSDHGVNLAIGSDFYNGTSVTEALFLAKQNAIRGGEPIGAFDNLTIVNMLASATPRAILPERKIGALRNGFEANFVVLPGNPVDDIANLNRVRAVYKGGETVYEAPVPKPDRER